MAVALVATAGLTVTVNPALETAELAFDALGSKTDVWCAWGAFDAGDTLSAWANSERVATLQAGATSATCAIPDDAQKLALPHMRFFLLNAANSSFQVDYIRSDWTQFIDTGYKPGPKTAICSDSAFEDLYKQQRTFGAHGSTFVVSSYINGSTNLAWACVDGDDGNWKNTKTPPKLDVRTVILLDGQNDKYTITMDGVQVYTQKLSADVAASKRTKTCDVSLYFFAQQNKDGTVTNLSKQKFYGAYINEAGARVHTYVPYVSGGAAGLLDTVTGTFLPNAAESGEDFVPHGCTGDVSGALIASAAVFTPGLTGLYSVDVPLGETANFSDFDDGYAPAAHTLVKMGSGTLVLDGTWTFGPEVVVSNGTIRANYATSGLANTHLVISGSGNLERFGVLQAEDAAITAPLCASGPGIELRGYAGIVPYEQPLTVNFHGDGRLLTRNSDGFGMIQLMLATGTNTCTFANGMDIKGVNLAVLARDSSTLHLTGLVSNSVHTAGTLNLWGTGNMVFHGTRGTSAQRPADFYGYQCYNHQANVVFSNATIRAYARVVTGTETAHAPHALFYDCNVAKIKGAASSSNDLMQSGDDATCTIAGNTTYDTRPAGFYVGNNSLKGTLVITNSPTINLNNFYSYDDVRMYGGHVTVTNQMYPYGKFLLYGGTNTVRFLQTRTGYYEIHGGRLEINHESRLGFSAGNPSTFYQTGGTVYNGNTYFRIGYQSAATYEMTGGSARHPGHCFVGAFLDGPGRLNVHGGTFNHPTTSTAMKIGDAGTGVVSVANGGLFSESNKTNGTWLAVSAARYYSETKTVPAGTTSSGTILLSPGGTFQTTRVRAGGNGRDAGVVFNGGTLKLNDKNFTSEFLDENLSRVVVTPYGGAIDTNGKGNFTLTRPLTEAVEARDLQDALAHRWSFNGGSLADSVGGADAALAGSAYLTSGAVRLCGDGWNTSCVNLGTVKNLLPMDGRGATVEMWVTPLSYRQWARVFDFGASNKGSSEKDLFFTFNVGEEDSSARFGATGAMTSTDLDVALQPGTAYHVALVLQPLPNGRAVHVTGYIHDAATGALLGSAARDMTSASWKLSSLTQANACWLGHSAYETNSDPDALYDEVRIHHRAMTADQVTESALAGPDAVYYFRKKGVGTLTMSGANAYTAGTSVDAGTLALAADATLPETPVRVASGTILSLNATEQSVGALYGDGTVSGGSMRVTGAVNPGGPGVVGTLTLDGTRLVAGTLTVDVAADGASDRLVTAGALDLSALSFAVHDEAKLDEHRKYTVVTAGSLAGSFAAVTLPKGWKVTKNGGTVTLSYSVGTVFLFR